VDADHAAWPTSNASTVPPRATRWTALGMRRSLLRLARASGAEVAELSVSRPDALAVALRLYVTNAAAFLRHRLRALVLHARQHESRYEGVYIEVDDARGQAWANAEARLGGLSYVRPNLRGCDPFPPPSPGPPGQPLPPCPT
jgi:hypothetical protein